MGNCCASTNSPIRHRIKLDRRYFLNERPTIFEASLRSIENITRAISGYLRDEYQSLNYTFLFHFPMLGKTSEFNTSVQTLILEGNECIIRFHEIPDKSFKLVVGEKSYTFPVDNNELISEIKTRIELKLRTGKPFKLFLQHLELEDHLYVKDYSIDGAQDIRISFSEPMSLEEPSSWKNLRSGLNLEVKCPNQSCRACNQIMFVPLGIGCFNILEVLEHPRHCEYCSTPLSTRGAFGLCNCQFLLEATDTNSEVKTDRGRLSSSDYLRKYAESNWTCATLTLKLPNAS